MFSPSVAIIPSYTMKKYPYVYCGWPRGDCRSFVVYFWKTWAIFDVFIHVWRVLAPTYSQTYIFPTVPYGSATEPPLYMSGSLCQGIPMSTGDKGPKRDADRALYLLGHIHIMFLASVAVIHWENLKKSPHVYCSRAIGNYRANVVSFWLCLL